MPEFETIISSASGIAASLAVIVAVRQLAHSQKASKLSVRPAIMSCFEYPDEGEPGKIYLKNSGLGPAEINKIIFYCEGKKVEGNLSEACEHIINQVGARTGICVFRQYQYQRDWVISQNEKLILVEFKHTGTPDNDGIEEWIGRLGIQIQVEYSDMYGKKYSHIEPKKERQL